MKLIQELSEMIEDEIDGAKEYITLALKIKDEKPELARTLFNISTQEMEHMKLLHDSVASVIEEYRKVNGSPPESMLAVYEYLHERHINAAAEVRTMQGMFR